MTRDKRGRPSFPAHLGARPLEADVVVPNVHLVLRRRADDAVVQTRQRDLVHYLTSEKVFGIAIPRSSRQHTQR